MQLETLTTTEMVTYLETITGIKNEKESRRLRKDRQKKKRNVDL